MTKKNEKAVVYRHFEPYPVGLDQPTVYMLFPDAMVGVTSEAFLLGNRAGALDAQAAQIKDDVISALDKHFSIAPKPIERINVLRSVIPIGRLIGDIVFPMTYGQLVSPGSPDKKESTRSPRTAVLRHDAFFPAYDREQKVLYVMGHQALHPGAMARQLLYLSSPSVWRSAEWDWRGGPPVVPTEIFVQGLHRYLAEYLTDREFSGASAHPIGFRYGDGERAHHELTDDLWPAPIFTFGESLALAVGHQKAIEAFTAKADDVANVLKKSMGSEQFNRVLAMIEDPGYTHDSNLLRASHVLMPPSQTLAAIRAKANEPGTWHSVAEHEISKRLNLEKRTIISGNLKRRALWNRILSAFRRTGSAAMAPDELFAWAGEGMSREHFDRELDALDDAWLLARWRMWENEKGIRLPLAFALNHEKFLPLAP